VVERRRLTVGRDSVYPCVSMIDAVVLVLITVPADADAAGLARTLVEDHLAACVSVGGEIRSIYRWQGAVEEATERQLYIKTTAATLDALRARMAQLHPYDVPEWLVLPALETGDAYLDWVRQATAT
jgi:periplasmic divalent cation tolerance protein